MMKRFLILALLSAASLHAQTQQDRIAVTTLVNRSIPALSGTTPNVSLGNVFFTASNGTITNFTGGTLSQQIWVICADAATAIAPGAIVTSGGTLSCQVNTVYSFIFNGTSWVESGTGSGGGGGGGSAPGLPNNSVQFACGGAFCGDSKFIWAPGSGLAIGGGAAYTHVFSTGTGSLNSLTLAPNAVSLNAGETLATLNLLSSGNTSFTVGAAHPFSLPTASGAPGTVLMSNGANPQVTSWSNSFSSGLAAPLGVLTTDINPFKLSFTFNNSSQVFNGVKWTGVNTAYGAGSFDYQFCAGVTGTACLTVDPLGQVAAPSQIGSGDGSAAGNLEMLQGPLPAILPNRNGFYAPTSVDAGGFLIQIPGSPCSGPLSVATTGAYGIMSCVVKGTFAALPACSSATEGELIPVTDSNTVTWGATIAGGSTNHVLAYCDASVWSVAAK